MQPNNLNSILCTKVIKLSLNIFSFGRNLKPSNSLVVKIPNKQIDFERCICIYIASIMSKYLDSNVFWSYIFYKKKVHTCPPKLLCYLRKVRSSNYSHCNSLHFNKAFDHAQKTNTYPHPPPKRKKQSRHFDVNG